MVLLDDDAFAKEPNAVEPDDAVAVEPLPIATQSIPDANAPVDVKPDDDINESTPAPFVKPLTSLRVILLVCVEPLSTIANTSKMVVDVCCGKALILTCPIFIYLCLTRIKYTIDSIQVDYCFL